MRYAPENSATRHQPSGSALRASARSSCGHRCAEGMETTQVVGGADTCRRRALDVTNVCRTRATRMEPASRRGIDQPGDFAADLTQFVARFRQAFEQSY